jgi:excisionase family DNA binding protein
MNQQLRLLTISEAADAFPGLAAYRIRTLIRSGELPAICAGKKYLICEQTLHDYILKKCGLHSIIPSQDNRVAVNERSSDNISG